MEAASRRRVLYTGFVLSLFLISTHAGPSEAREQSCIDRVTADLLSRLKQGREALAELGSFDRGGTFGTADLIHALDEVGKCVPCRYGWISKPAGGWFEAATVLSCEGGPLHVALWIEDSPEVCKLQAIKPSTSVHEVNRHLGIRGIDPEDCAWPPTPSGPIMVGGDVQAPLRVSDPDPSYTPEARAARIQGIVILQLTVDKKGNVTDSKILKGLPMGLGEKARETAKTWKFRPAILNGRPVAVYYNVTVSFTLK